MATNRISILVALDGSDDGLKRAVASAERSLGELSAQARTAGERAQAGLEQVRAGVSAFSEQFGRAKAQLVAFLAAFEVAGALRDVVAIADAWNQMTARLQLATAGQREYAAAQSALFEIAQRIGVPLQETAALYGRLQQAVRMLSLEQRDALAITETISQALRLSGASAEESRAALLQFGQALASGVLRGEEFNSVVENSPRLAQALADGLNVPIGRLRKLAEEGRLTADVVVNALLSQKERLATEYAQLPATVSQAMERVRNAFGRWVHQLDESTGFTRKLADALTWLAQHLDAVMKALTVLRDVGLAVLIYRFLPALVTAWQTAGAAAVTAAHAAVAAWATVNLSVAGAIASIGLLKTAFAVLGAFFVGWQIGTWLSEEFAVVRQAGIFMVEVLMQGVELLRYHWEAFAAVFTSDTIAEATQRHQARLAEMNRIFGEMVADAGRGADAAQGAMHAAATAAEEIARRLEAVRQGTQEAVGRGVEAVHGALEKLKSRLGEVEQTVGKANQTVNEATARMAEAYRGLTAIVEGALQQQINAVKARYEQEQAALELSRQSAAASIAASTRLLTDALMQQTALRRQATMEALQLIDGEAQARVDAARRQGQTEAERAANVRRAENEILAIRRQTLAQALAEYQRHVDALNAEANRHLTEVRRIEDEKRQLAMTTDERVREIQRQGMTEFEATEDRKRQVAELQTKAREALAHGEFDVARQLAQKAMDLAAQVAGAQTAEAKRAEEARKASEQAASEVSRLEAQSREAAHRREYQQAQELMRQADQLREQIAQRSRAADQAAAQGKSGVAQAIESIRQSQELLNQALDAEGRAHQQAAQSALSARDGIRQTLAQTSAEIDQITAKLKDGLTFTLDADTSRFAQALAELDKALAEKERLLPIKADLEHAEKQLQDFEQQLKNGGTLPVNADVSQARAALEQLNAYARETSQLELRVATEKAQAAVANVAGQIRALDQLRTESRHQVRSNVDAVQAEIRGLDGMNTSSTHTVQVRKVEANAGGGVAGEGPGPVRRFADGGAVASAFTRLGGGMVPGSGNHDTVPRRLDAGAFVIRKAAVRKYGDGALTRLANGIARFATGGAVALPRQASSGPPRRNREAAEALKMIELGLQGMNDYTGWLQGHHGSSVSLDMRSKTMAYWGQFADRDRKTLNDLLGRPQLTGHERQLLEEIKQRWRQAMAQPLTYGKDLERDLLAYMAEHQGEFYARGGVARADTVPAMLTPGEYVVNKEAVQRLGVGFFEAINRMTLPARALAQQVRGFATGGLVRSGLAAQAARLLPSVDLGALVAQSLTNTIRIPRAAPVSLDSAPTKTIRVELAAGHTTVPAAIDARDEPQLLALLRRARDRSS